MAAAAFTVRDALVAAGVDNVTLFQGETAAQRMAADLFSNDFKTSMDKSFDDLDEDFKTYSGLTNAQGQIRLLPGTKQRIKAFVQWSRDQIRMGRNPTMLAFPVAETGNLIRRYKTHAKYLKDSSTMSDAAKPKDFSANIKWSDWKPTLINYLRLIPGRDGVPLSYVVRENAVPDQSPKTDFLAEYIAAAPLVGDAYPIDTAQVAVIITSLIVGNTEAETKVQSLPDANNGRSIFETLDNHYAGIGVYAKDVAQAEKILNSLFYSGEKKPHMWWDEFERQLQFAYAAYDKKEGRIVHSNEMKLRTLMGKVNADFLQNIKASLNIELARIPLTLTYEHALSAFRNAVNQKHPPEMSAPHRARRNIREVRRFQRGGRGNGRGSGRGGRGNQRGERRTRTDSEIITLTDGKKIEYHPSFHFPIEILRKFTQEQRDKMKRQRQEYKRQRNNRNADDSTHRTIQELQSQIQELRSLASDQRPPNNINADEQTQVSQVTTGTRGTTMMGGRNSQTGRK